MGKEFQMAREEEQRQPVLLARTGTGEDITSAFCGDTREEEAPTPNGHEGAKVQDTKAKSKSNRKAKRVVTRTARAARRESSNKNREQNRRNERKNKRIWRSAEELGIEHPGSYCDDNKIQPHYWMEIENIEHGVLFKCKLCYKYLWNPLSYTESIVLGKYTRKYGLTSGYRKYLDNHRPAKIMIAKMQDLARLEKYEPDKMKFAKLAAKIMSDKEYDKKTNNNTVILDEFDNNPPNTRFDLF